jgi:hypothetical protein
VPVTHVECIYVTVGHTPTYEELDVPGRRLVRSRPDLEGKWWYAVELLPEHLHLGETGDLVLFFM